MATNWSLEFTPSARREFRNLPDRVKDQAAQALADLIESPIPFDAIPLRGYPDSYRSGSTVISTGSSTASPSSSAK